MTKINKKWVIISLILWLFCCQGLFILVQKSAGEKTVGSIQNQLRQELNFSDFHFLARSISDFTVSGAIKCAVFEKTSPEFIAVVDLRYMEPSCNTTPLLLEGSYFDVSLKTLNGDIYRLKFISNNSRFFSMALWGFRLIGIVLIMAIVIAFSLKEQKDLIKFQLELDFANKLSDMALQVSHDIRSPLAALQVATEEIQNIDLQNAKIIKIAMERINDIANNLLKKNIEVDAFEQKIEKIFPILDCIVTEKQFEFKNFNVSIELNSDPNMQDLLVNMGHVEVKRIISNLINNSVEALPNGSVGKVLITLNLLNQNTVLITVSDNGKGISSELMNRIGEKGFSFDKENNKKAGSGLGLYHAKSYIEKIGGKFAVESEINNGTVVKIFLPCAFKDKELITIVDSYDCVLLDNDELVILIWESRALKNNIKLLVIRNCNEFKSYKSNLDKLNTVIYIDSELGDNHIKGEEFAQELYDEGFSKIILTTGHSKEKFSHIPWLGCIGKTCPF